MAININFYDRSMLIFGHSNNIFNSSSNANFDETCDLEESDFEVVSDELQENDNICIPNELNVPKALEWLAKIQNAGWLDERYQPVGLTLPKMGCIVMKAQFELELSNCWKDFSLLWNVNKETLRVSFMKGQNTKPTRDFNRLLNEI